MPNSGKLYGKLIMSAEILCQTGLHIGMGNETMEIGGLDNAVIRDPLTREPYIPGSSLKGKMRSLLERQLFATKNSGQDIDKFFNKRMKAGDQPIRHHECSEEGCPVCRLFGACQGDGVAENSPARLSIGDSCLNATSKSALEKFDTGFYLTEQKYENNLDRITSAANPRQQERVPRGSVFEMNMIYTADAPLTDKNVQEDLKYLFNCLLLLRDDGLGGSVSRGYGRVEFKKFRIQYRPVAFYLGETVEKVFSQGETETLADFGAKLPNWIQEGQ